MSHEDRVCTFAGYGEDVTVIYDPSPDGNCQFSAISHQLSRLGIFRDANTLRIDSVQHLRQNKTFYSSYIPQNFEEYLQSMEHDGFYGDNLTLLALTREYNCQCVVISSAGQAHCTVVSNDGIFDQNMITIYLGYFPEGEGTHYLSITAKQDFISDMSFTESPTTLSRELPDKCTDPLPGSTAHKPQRTAPPHESTDSKPESLDPSHVNTDSAPESSDPPQENTDYSAQESTNPLPENTDSEPESSDPSHENTDSAPESSDPSHENTDSAPKGTDHPPENTDSEPESTDPPSENTDSAPESTDPSSENTESAPQSTVPSPENTDSAPEGTDPPSENIESAPESTDPPPENTDSAPESTDPPPKNTDSAPENTDTPPKNTESVPDSTDTLDPQIKCRGPQPENTDSQPDILTLQQLVERQRHRNKNLRTQSIFCFDMLPLHVQIQIVKICLKDNPAIRFVLNKIEHFREIIKLTGILRPSIYLSEGILEEVPQRISVRRLLLKCGRNSGVILEIKNVIKEPRWSNAWLCLRACEDRIRWYEIVDIWYTRRN